MGPLATTVNLHFDAAIPNFLIQEMRPFTDVELSFVKSSPVVKDGHHQIPSGPGWGIELDIDAIAEASLRVELVQGRPKALGRGPFAYI